MKITPLTEADTKQLLVERKRSYTRKCEACDSFITNSKPFLRWHTMEFCDIDCFTTFIDANNGYSCWSCDSIIRPIQLGVHCERIENELRLFCSAECRKTYLAKNKMCNHCGKVLELPTTLAEGAERFCSIDCDRKFRRMYSQDRDERAVEKCTDCYRMKNVLVNFLYDGQLYPYCSYVCFFFLKFTCGIYAGNLSCCGSKSTTDAYRSKNDSNTNRKTLIFISFQTNV